MEYSGIHHYSVSGGHQCFAFAALEGNYNVNNEAIAINEKALGVVLAIVAAGANNSTNNEARAESKGEGDATASVPNGSCGKATATVEDGDCIAAVSSDSACTKGDRVEVSCRAY